MEQIIYATVFRLWGKKEEDGKIWVEDKSGRGTIHDSEIVAIARIKPRVIELPGNKLTSYFIPLLDNMTKGGLDIGSLFK